MLLTFQFDAFRYALAKLINYDFSEKEKAQRLLIPLIKTKLRSIYLIILSDNKNERETYSSRKHLFSTLPPQFYHRKV